MNREEFLKRVANLLYGKEYDGLHDLDKQIVSCTLTAAAGMLCDRCKGGMPILADADGEWHHELVGEGYELNPDTGRPYRDYCDGARLLALVIEQPSPAKGCGVCYTSEEGTMQVNPRCPDHGPGIISP